ncbi:MAG: ABC transporter permease [Gammaproteobacteria bacterium]
MRGVGAVIILDLKRLWVERWRIVSNLGQPLLYLFILGSGLGASTMLGGGGYRHFIFPGVLGLSILFTSVFSAILIVFDRQMGFLKAVLVAPVPRRAIAIGKILSGMIQGLIPALILLVFIPVLGLPTGALHLLALIGAMTLAALTFSALGVAVAARFESTTVFPIVINAVLLPMFFVSGALFPLGHTPMWLQGLAHADPVAYAIDLMRGALLGKFYFPPWLSLAVLCGLILILTWLATRVFASGEDG